MAKGVIVQALGNGGGGGGRSDPLLPRKATSYGRCLSHAGDELKSFRSCLRWMCVDQSDSWHAAISWSLFLVLGVFVPTATHFVLSYSPSHRTYDAIVQLALTSASVLSYLCLSAFVRRYGLRRFLFLDKLVKESEQVRMGYMAQLNRSFRLLSLFVTPCFAGEVAYKVWWYCTGSERVPFTIMGSAAVVDALACVLELASWIYRIAIFFYLCVLFRLLCYLQLLRLQDFAAVFGAEGSTRSDVAGMLKEHVRIRRHLKIISHRFRGFFVSCLVLVTASQLASLLLTTRPGSVVNLFTAGELALSSVVLVTGILMCLRTAAKITHKAQALASHAATWHICATIESFDVSPEDPVETPDAADHPKNSSGDDESDDDEDKDDDEFDIKKLVSSNINTISFQKRQALVTYLENNKAGITVFGFVVDRTWLHALFMIEFSLVMWLLGKTIGI